MKIPAYPKALAEMVAKSKNQASKHTPDNALIEEYDEGVIREMKLQDSIENNNDPNDMPLEIEKNLNSNLGPVDTEFEKQPR